MTQPSPLEPQHRDFLKSYPPKEYLDVMASRISAIEALTRTRVMPLLTSQVNRTLVEECLFVTYHRMSLWMSTLTRLTDHRDFQAGPVAARSLLELLVDIHLLLQYGDDAAVKFEAFHWVERFRVGQAQARFYDEHFPALSEDSARRTFVTDPDNIKQYGMLRKTHWNKEGSQTLDHWWNAKFFERCRIVDRERAGTSRPRSKRTFEERYRNMYAMTSWYVHAGPTGFMGMPSDGFLVAFAFSLGFAGQYFYEATKLIGDHFRVFDADVELREDLKKANQVAGQLLIESYRANKAADARESEAE